MLKPMVLRIKSVDFHDVYVKNRWISEDEKKFKKFEDEDSSYGIGSTSME